MVLTLVRLSQEEDGLERFCRRLQIISSRDMDGTVTVVFRSMLTKGRQRPVGSSELAQMTHLNRVTIIHHLQRLEQMGFVKHTERKYRLCVSDLSEAVERMREDMLRSFQEADELAAALDREFGLAQAEQDRNDVNAQTTKQTRENRQTRAIRSLLQPYPALAEPKPFSKNEKPKKSRR